MFEPPQGALVAETAVEVRSYELDSYGHANHAVFLNYLEFGRFEAFRAAGFPYEVLKARGWSIYVVRVEIDYLSEARLGQLLTIQSWVQAYRRSTMVLAQRITAEDDPDRLVARALVTVVWLGPDRRPVRVPDEVRAALKCASEGEAAPSDAGSAS